MRTPVKTGQKRAHVNNGTVNAHRSADVMRWRHRFREKAPYPAWHQTVASSGSLGSNIITLNQCLTVFVRGKLGLDVPARLARRRTRRTGGRAWPSARTEPSSGLI